jgi:hypothetical protein
LFDPAVMHALHYHELVAAKAALCLLAADGRDVIKFGFRVPTLWRSACALPLPRGLAVWRRLRTWRPADATVFPLQERWHPFDHEIDAFASSRFDHPHDPTLLLDTYDAVIGQPSVP